VTTVEEVAGQARRIAVLLPQIARNLRLAALVERVRHGLTTAQLMALFILRDGDADGLAVSQLAREMGVSVPTVTGMADRLVEAGMLKRVHSETDRRVVLLRLSRDGLEVAERLRAILEDLITRILKDMSPEAHRAITDAMEQVFALSQQVRKEETVLVAVETGVTA
jgi:DNA-binding MarR family transcriptional regulator